MTEPAYFLSWSSRFGKPVRAGLSRQDDDGWTVILELLVDDMGDGRAELLAAMLEHHLGRPALVDELDLVDKHSLRITATELDRALAVGTQQALFRSTRPDRELCR